MRSEDESRRIAVEIDGQRGVQRLGQPGEQGQGGYGVATLDVGDLWLTHARPPSQLGL